MAEASYNQFCPIAMAAEILCSRWTLVLVRELVVGSTRFNDLRRGMPRISPALLSKRLKELEAAGIVVRTPVTNEPGIFEYQLTASGRDLAPVVEAVGVWGQRWVETEPSLKHLDPELLMWDMRRNLDLRPMPKKRSTIQFMYPEQPRASQNWWLIVDPNEAVVDLCSVDPGFDVDLFVSSNLRTMTEIWMGFRTIGAAMEDDKVMLTGSRELEHAMPAWLGLSPFAKIDKQVS